MNIMEECIPKAKILPRRNRPWLTKRLRQAIRRKNALYKRAKMTGNFSKYHAYGNKVTASLTQAKMKYFQKLNPKDWKQFWKTCKLYKTLQILLSPHWSKVRLQPMQVKKKLRSWTPLHPALTNHIHLFNLSNFMLWNLMTFKMNYYVIKTNRWSSRIIGYYQVKRPRQHLGKNAQVHCVQHHSSCHHAF